MANDTFGNLDQQQLAMLNQRLAEVSQSAVKGTASVRDFAKEVTHIAEAMNRIENKAILNPKNLDETYDLVDKIKKKMLELGAPIKDINDALETEQLKLKGQLIDYSKLGALTKLRYGWEKLTKDEVVGYTKKGKEYVPVLESQVSLMSKMRIGAASTAGSIAGWATSLGGVSLSIAGIAAKMLEAYDAVNRIHAMSVQTNAQWSKGNQSIGEATSLQFQLQKQFKMTVDQAGQYVTSLARAGFEKNQVLGMSKSLLANEIVYGQSIDSQVSAVKNLYLNFNKTTEQALNYVGAIREAAKDMPGLSMDEVLKDITDLADRQKYYNVNLLGTIGLYATLMNKKLSKSLGMENVSTEFKKSLMTGLASAGESMPAGWRAFFGAKAGEAPSITTKQRFEDMDAPQRLEAIVKGIPRLLGSSAMGGTPTDSQKEVLRSIVKSLGVLDEKQSREFSKLMSGSGPLSADKIGNFLMSAYKQSKKAEKDLAEEQTRRQKTIDKAMGVAADLQSTADAIAQAIGLWLMQNVVPYIKEIVGNIKRLAEKFTGGVWSEFIDMALGTRDSVILNAFAANARLSKAQSYDDKDKAVKEIIADTAESAERHGRNSIGAVYGNIADAEGESKAYEGLRLLQENYNRINMDPKEIQGLSNQISTKTGISVPQQDIKRMLMNKAIDTYRLVSAGNGPEGQQQSAEALAAIFRYTQRTNRWGNAFEAITRKVTIDEVLQGATKTNPKRSEKDNKPGREAGK